MSIELNESFFALTPERVLQAAEAMGFVPSGHCFALNSLENRVYDLRLEDGNHIVVKFYRPGRWTSSQIQAEHELLFKLAESEIPVCSPLRFENGHSLGEIAGIYFAIWPRTGGRSLDEFTPEQLCRLGRLVARIHNVGAVSSSAKDGLRPELNTENYIHKPLQVLSQNGFLPEDLAEEYMSLAQAIGSIYDQLIVDVPRFQIHGDCHIGNLLCRLTDEQEDWYFLDFDDSRVGPAVQDLWMLVSRDASGRADMEYILEGYRQFREFDTNWLNLIEPLRAMRFVHYSAWIARRIKDPAFPNAFPHFNERDYWTQELIDLRDQLSLIHGQSPHVANSAGVPEDAQQTDEELTNADFFWDMQDE